MKIIFHEKYREEYAFDPAAKSGRLDKAVEVLEPHFEFVQPDMCTEQDVLRVHTKSHFDMVSEASQLFTLSLLAAGGAVEAAELAVQGEPTFALIRPPGHHASPDDCWGFCWFNNIAVAIEKLRMEGKINKAFILDFDLHFGDGTRNYFSGIPEVTYFHMDSVNSLPMTLNNVEECDIVAVSAGFDRHIEDWGGMLSTMDYNEIGVQVKQMSDRICPNKVFAVLEGGYNNTVLAESVRAFCEGLEGKAHGK